MANENNNINELVSDDDVTAELEIPNFRAAFNDDEVGESDLHTYDVKDRDKTPDDPTPTLSELQSDLRSRKKTIGRLQFDIEQLRSKWMGLEAEIEARENQTSSLATKVDELDSSLTRKERLIKKRDRRIRSLKAEIRERQEEHQQLVVRFDALSEEFAEAQQVLQQPAPEPRVIEQPATRDLEFRLAHSEDYADGLRRQLQDALDSDSSLEDNNERLNDELTAAHEDLNQARAESSLLADQLQAELGRAEKLEAQLAESDLKHADEIKTLRFELGEAQDTAVETGGLNVEMSEELETLRERKKALQEQLSNIEDEHAEELRTLRFELGEAQDTMVEKDEINNQLASDLVDTRGFKEELERMLSEAEKQSQARIDELEKEVSKLADSAEQHEEKLSTKSEAIAVLLAELAKKSEQLDSIGAIEDVIHDIDGRISDRMGDDAHEDASHIVLGNSARSDRVTRVLVGTVEDQVLRFPLFKDRLTIGRTSDNDIQLEAAYISRRHAVIQTERGATRIIDWGSKNGVYVNSDRITEHFLDHGDIVTIGNARFRYEERKKRDT